MPFLDTTNLVATSPLFTTYNGPALRGYFSNDGMTNIICPQGTYNPSLYET